MRFLFRFTHYESRFRSTRTLTNTHEHDPLYKFGAQDTFSLHLSLLLSTRCSHDPVSSFFCLTQYRSWNCYPLNQILKTPKTTKSNHEIKSFQTLIRLELSTTKPGNWIRTAKLFPDPQILSIATPTSWTCWFQFNNNLALCRASLNKIK
jgi:hypothetical protein